MQILGSLRRLVKHKLLRTFFEVDVVSIEQPHVLGRVGVPFLHSIKFNNIISSPKAMLATKAKRTSVYVIASDCAFV